MRTTRTFKCAACGALATTTRGSDHVSRLGLRCSKCTTADAAGFSDRGCRVCGCMEWSPCETSSGPCAWQIKYTDNTGICTACPVPTRSAVR